MTRDAAFEATVAAWLAAQTSEDVPAGFVERVVAVTAVTRRRRAWLPSRRLALPRIDTWWLTRPASVKVAIVLALIAASILGAAAFLPRRHALPGSGLLVYDNGGVLQTFDQRDGAAARITSGSFDTAPSFSPDGTKIAFWRRSGPGLPASLWVMNSDGSNQHNITGQADLSGNESVRAVWSPDSAMLAFAVGDYYSSSHLYVTRADGTGLREIGADNLSRTDPSWSPDGSLIAFRGHTVGELPDEIPPDPAIGIYVIAPDGSGQRRVGSSGAGAPSNWGAFGWPSVGAPPSWLPDGRSLLYPIPGPKRTHLLVIGSVDNSSETSIPLPPNSNVLPVVSPDGSRVAFIASYDRDTHAGTLAVAGIDGTHLVMLRGGQPVAGQPPLWSPDGSSILAYDLNVRSILIFDASPGHETAPPVVISVPDPPDINFGGDALYDRATWQPRP